MGRMDTERAIAVIRALADDVDLQSGEPLPIDGTLQHAETVRALHTACLALEAVRGTDRRRSTRAIRS